MGLVDADYKFIWADLSGKGSSSDAQIYNDSEIKEFAENGTIGFPTPDALPNDYQDVTLLLHRQRCLRPPKDHDEAIQSPGLDNEERIFNYMLPRARRVVENAFGILTNRFQVLLTTMQHHPSTVKVIVKAFIVLHNLRRLRYPGLPNQHLNRAENMNRDFIPGAWRQDRNLQDTHTVAGRNTSTNKAKKQRNLLKHWANSGAGAVPWQDRMI